MSNAIDLPGGWGRLRPCLHGLFLYNVNDVYIGRSLDVYGEYSEVEARVLAALLRPDDVVVEAGANIGALTVPLARAVGSDGLVLAYEPQRIAHQMLCANIALNGLTNVIAWNAAVGEAPGATRVPTPDPRQPNNFGDVALERARPDDSEAVAVVTIDSANLPRCRLIKVDVQGTEASVLKGAARTIAAHRPALYVENDQRARSPALIALIRSMGYRMWWHVAPLHRPDNHAGVAEDVFDNTICLNLLCFPSEAGVEIDGAEVRSDDDWPPDIH